MQALYFIHYGFTILAKKGQKVSNIYICDMQIQDISCHKKKRKTQSFWPQNKIYTKIYFMYTWTLHCVNFD